MNAEYIRKYSDASSLISGVPPSQWGSAPLMLTPITARTRPMRNTVVSPCLITALAPLKSCAPQRWATWTENPELAPDWNPPIIQVVVATRPIDADWFAPSWPTIPASMYCISTDEN